MAKRRSKRFKKPARKLTKNRIYVKDWMEGKPYDNFTPYDQYYTDIANEIWKILAEYDVFFKRQKLGKENYIQFSLFLTSYFEDFISEIGIWEAFVKENEVLYNRALPLIGLKGYDKDYINIQDISFLVWYYMNSQTSRLFAPDNMVFVVIAENVYDLLESKIDTAPATSFYDDFYTIPDDIYFFELKTKLIWFSKQTYIPGFEFSIGFDGDKEELIQLLQKNANFKPEYFSHFLYSITDSYIYRKRTSLLAWTTLEWFTNVARCSESMKQNILQLSKYIKKASFILDGVTETHYLLREVHTNNVFNVNIESAKLPSTEKGQLYTLNIHPWNDEWWISGMVAGSGEPTEKILADIKKDFQDTPFYAYEKGIQQRLIEITHGAHQLFLEYFGAPLVIVPDSKTANKKIQDFYIFQNRNISKKSSDEPSIGLTDVLDINSMNTNIKDGVALLSIPHKGIAIDLNIPRLIQLLQSPVPLSEQVSDNLFTDLTHDVHPSILSYILKTYPKQRIQFPINESSVIASENMEFFARYYNPLDFGDDIPNTRELPSTS